MKNYDKVAAFYMAMKEMEYDINLFAKNIIISNSSYDSEVDLEEVIPDNYLNTKELSNDSKYTIDNSNYCKATFYLENGILNIYYLFTVDSVEIEYIVKGHVNKNKEIEINESKLGEVLYFFRNEFKDELINFLKEIGELEEY